MHDLSPSPQRRSNLPALTVALLVAAIAFGGCGEAVEDSLVESAGVHGNALEEVFVLQNQNVLSKVSSRDLKDINAALAANDLKRASAGDLRRAQSEIRSRIRRLEKYEQSIKDAARKLKAMPKPDFVGGLDDDAEHDAFAKAYASTTNQVERFTSSDAGAVKSAFNSMKSYLAFLEQWEQFVKSNDTSGLLSAGQASDKALARLKSTTERLQRRGSVNSKIEPLVDDMAAAASESPQLTTLVDELKKQHTKSFLAVHIVEK